MNVNDLKTPADFYAFFDKIPENKWAIGSYVAHDDPESCCARGHLGERSDIGYYPTTPATTLTYLLSRLSPDSSFIVMVNDGRHHHYRQRTPKQRILAALQDLIDLEKKGVGNVGHTLYAG